MNGSEDDSSRIDSDLTWDQVRLPSSLTEAEFDRVILSKLGPHWRKVAAIVIRVAENYEHLQPAITYEMVAARLQALSEAGTIESRGHMRMWRHSEIRLRD